MKTMTIRNIPDDVAAFISERALDEGRSINMMTVALLSKAVGLTGKPRQRRDLSWLSGSWTEAQYQEFARTVGDCRKVDAEGWS